MSAGGSISPGLAPGARLAPVLFFAIVPVAVLLLRSVGALGGAVLSSLSGEAGAFGNTLVISIGAALFALVLGAPLSLLLFRTDLPLRGGFAVLFTLPSA